MESNATHNSTTSSNNGNNIPIAIAYYIIAIFILLVSLLGMVGNSTVIWMLSRYIKRNPFTTYILNLSVADFGVLMTLGVIYICWVFGGLHPIECPLGVAVLLFPFFLFTFSTSQFLLAAISIDRCICVFFPLWHKCHRPSHLSTILCVTIWILTFLFSVIVNAFTFTLRYPDLPYYQFLLNAVLFMPAMLISTIAMLIKVCFMSPHHKWGKLLTAILVALLFFLLFAFPMNAIQLVFTDHIPASSHYVPIGASLNSAVNPVIYFLVGREKNAQSGRRIKKILEKVFQEEESCKEERHFSLVTRL
ncbi:mas-related G-protein coupled receptor member H-like [Pogona vitticeps]